MAVFKPNFDNQNAYVGTKTLHFGFDGPYADYWTPAMVFSFYDPRGNSASSKYANIYIRMSGTFETQSLQGYDVATNIFSQPSAQAGAASTILQGAKGTIQGIVNQVVTGAAGTMGFLGSGGQSGRQQIEFLTREVFNTFQQLIYQGPNFRQFSPSFQMRPTSQSQAEIMREIIARLKIASSPESGTLQASIDAPNGEGDNVTFEGRFTQGQTQGFIEGVPFTFGYPHMCKIEVGLIKAKDFDLVRVFQSDYCMIQSIATTYGSQNKLTFFAGVAYPTEVNLQVQLREAVLQTRGNAVREFNGGLTVI